MRQGLTGLSLILSLILPLILPLTLSLTLIRMEAWPSRPAKLGVNRRTARLCELEVPQ